MITDCFNTYFEMKICGFKVQLNLPGRHNVWALFLLLFSIASLIQGITATDWMASYRNGDSIIPRKDELTKIGPFLMHEIRTRNAILVGFANPDGKIKYKEDAYDVTIPASTVLNLINEYSGLPVAYLFIYKNNPIRQIWGINVNGVEVLSYRDSISSYKTMNSSAYAWFWSFAVCLIWFFISIFDVQRVRNVA